MAITRNASEALQIAQLGIDLKPGDEVVTTNQDYGRMLDTWEQRVRRDGITLTKVSFPVPPESMDVLAERLGTTRGALYKTLHDARRKLRRASAVQIAVKATQQDIKPAVRKYASVRAARR